MARSAFWRVNSPRYLLEQFRDQCDALKLLQLRPCDEAAVREFKSSVGIFKIRSVRHPAVQKRNGPCLFHLNEFVVLAGMATDLLIDQQKGTDASSQPSFLSRDSGAKNDHAMTFNPWNSVCFPPRLPVRRLGAAAGAVLLLGALAQRTAVAQSSLSLEQAIRIAQNSPATRMAASQV